MKLKFVHNELSEFTQQLEHTYPASVQLDLRAKEELRQAGAEFVFLIDEDTGDLIGETSFIDLDKVGEEITGLDDWKGKRAVYVYSITVAEPYRGKKFGRLLKGYFYGLVRGKFDYALGHAREPASLRLNQLFGAETLGHVDDWFGTGERYFLYKRDL